MRNIPEKIEQSENLKWLGITLLIGVFIISAGNLVAQEPEKQVGLTDVETDCFGVDAGVCIGIERFDHTTYNYDDYEKPENGTEDFYRMVESQLMIQAYEYCGGNVEGMEWTENASYAGKNVSEWQDSGDVDLLPCSRVTFHPMSD